jgi:hypothetical protein
MEGADRFMAAMMGLLFLLILLGFLLALVGG